jgi:hypothetical protein
MSPTAIFNRFDLSASNGEHCGEYRVAYHKNYGTRLFLIFEAQYPNPEPSKGKKGCFAVADFWQKIGQMSKADALVQLEKFFLTVSATKTTSPWLLMSVLNSLSCHGL